MKKIDPNDVEIRKHCVIASFALAEYLKPKFRKGIKEGLVLVSLFHNDRKEGHSHPQEYFEKQYRSMFLKEHQKKLAKMHTERKRLGKLFEVS